MLCQEAIRLSVENSGLLGLLGAPTYPMLRDVVIREMLSILEENHIPFTYQKAEHLLILTDMGSEILFRTMDNPERLRGTTLAWFGVDELTYCHEDAWSRLEARLSHPHAKERCGFGVWTPNGFDWVYRKMVQTLNAPGSPQVVFAEPGENKALPPDYYDQLKGSYDQRFYEQEVLGKYLNITQGQAYWSYTEENTRAVSYQASAGPLIWSCDFNVNPLCSVICQAQAGGVVAVLKEIRLEHAHTPDSVLVFMEVITPYLAEWRKRYSNRPLPIQVHGDAAGHTGSRRSNAARSDYELIQQGFRNQTACEVSMQHNIANPLVRDRVAAVNAKLCNAAGERTLLIDPSCIHLIKDLREVSWKQGSFELDKVTNPMITHLSDALGYYIYRDFPVNAFRRVITKPN